MQPYSRVDIKQHRFARFHNIVQWPRIPVVIESRRQFNRVESRANVRDDPENKPDGRPRSADDHGDILTSKPQRTHPDEVDHPVDDEARLAVRGRMQRNFHVTCWRVRKWKLKGETHERVRQ